MEEVEEGRWKVNEGLCSSGQKVADMGIYLFSATKSGP